MKWCLSLSKTRNVRNSLKVSIGVQMQSGFQIIMSIPHIMWVRAGPT